VRTKLEEGDGSVLDIPVLKVAASLMRCDIAEQDRPSERSDLEEQETTFSAAQMALTLRMVRGKGNSW